MRRQVKVTSTVCAYELHLWINHVPVHSLKSIFTTLLIRLENASVSDSINIVPFISEQTLTIEDSFTRLSGRTALQELAVFIIC